jgi:hypothetical protein
MFSRERKKGQVSSSLDRDGQPALVFCAGASLTAGFDLASLCKKPAQGGYVLVFDDL